MNRNTIASGRRRRTLLPMLLAVALAVPLGSAASAQNTTSVASPPDTACLAWTADRSSIVYCTGSRDGRSELFERYTNGNVRQLTYLGGKIESADVSSDGDMVTFHATVRPDPKPQVYVISRHGPRLRRVVVGSAVLEIGNRTVMVGGTPIEIKGVVAKRLTDDGSNLDPTFAPDGDRIGFSSDRLGSVALWSMNVDGSDQRELPLASAD